MDDEFQFQGIDYNSQQTPLTLTPLLYCGGAACDMRNFFEVMGRGQLGSQRLKRFTLVLTLFRVLSNIVSTGGSLQTLKAQINHLRGFYKFADSRHLEPTMKGVVKIYQLWVREIYQKSKASGKKEITDGDYGKASSVASLLGQATSLGRDTFVKSSKLRAPRKSTRALGAKSDRQDLEKTKIFAEVIIDIISSLSGKACHSRLPVKIGFRNGTTIDHYGALNQHAAAMAPTAHQLNDVSPSVRYPLLNLRVEAEMMLFISQTSMNLGEAAKLEMQNFRYKSDGAFTQVYGYKNRKKGEVLFTIYNEYKPFFLDYLKFKNFVGLGDHTDLVFGKVCQPGHVLSKNSNPRSLISFLKRVGLTHIPASTLRCTRQNWLARMIGDPEIAAEMGQHDLKTFAVSYSRPHHQTAAVEFTRYYKSLESTRGAVMNGACDTSEPRPIASAPKNLNKPDCINPALCFFCENYKGIRSYDYIWSLLTYQKLKRYEGLCNKCSPDEPNELLERIQQISEQFRCASTACAGWVLKAEGRVASGEHHPRWAGFFDLIELRML